MIRLYLRSLFIQALVNYRWMQGNAFRYILRRNRVENSTAIPFFNTHPWLAPGVIGLLAKMRAEHADAREQERVRLRWMGTLGAVGDGVFWSVYRPVAIGVALLLLFWQPSLFWLVPLLFWCFSLLVRWQVLRSGRRGEEAFFLWLERMHPQQIMHLGRKYFEPAIFVGGVGLAFAYLHRLGAAVGLQYPWWTVVWMGITVAGLLLLGRQRSGLPLATVAALIYLGWYYVGV